MPNIYDQHAAAFAQVSAFVVVRDGKLIARIAFKRARSNLQLTCYMHVLGVPMIRTSVTGGGYDKHSAVCHKALQRLAATKWDEQARDASGAAIANVEALARAVTDGGRSWNRDMEDAGFSVFEAV